LVETLIVMENDPDWHGNSSQSLQKRRKFSLIFVVKCYKS
jgi:hypothetical protein